MRRISTTIIRRQRSFYPDFVGSVSVAGAPSTAFRIYSRDGGPTHVITGTNYVTGTLRKF